MDNHGGIKVSDFSEAVKELVADMVIVDFLSSLLIMPP